MSVSSEQPGELRQRMHDEESKTEQPTQVYSVINNVTCESHDLTDNTSC